MVDEEAVEVTPNLKAPLDPRILRSVVLKYVGEKRVVPTLDNQEVFHGEGEAQFCTGFVYRGHFAHGRMHGKGRIEWPHGVVYEGDFVENEIRGAGQYTWPNGSTYVGDVVDGKRHGRGVFIAGHLGTPEITNEAGTEEGPAGEGTTENVDVDDNSGLRFHFHEDMDQNLAVRSNARYEGEWRHGLPDGYGILVYDDALNVRYEGHFMRGLRHGVGSMRYASGDMYEGDWRDNVKCGHGVMTWHKQKETTSPMVEQYEGEWVNDEQEGYGRHVWSSCRQKEKNWYEGQFHAGLRHGRGVFYYANGARYEGEWHENLKHGRGMFFYEDGRVFVGTFHNDRAVDEAPGSDDGATASQASSASLPSASATATATSTASATSTTTRMILYIDGLLPTAVGDRVKAKKAVANAALRLNTDLRALYRSYLKDPTGTIDEPDGLVLELHACCRLLCDCGVFVGRGQLEQLVLGIREAQRRAALVEAKQSVADWVIPVRTERRSAIVDIIAHDRLVLFREFIEVLVRLAHGHQLRQGLLRHEFCLADAFTDLVERMQRQRVQGKRSATPQLHEQLYCTSTQLIMRKHQALLRQLFDRAIGRQADVDEAASDEPVSERLSVRKLVESLKHMSQISFFSAAFRVADALKALAHVLTPAMETENDDAEIPDPGWDPFLVEMDLSYCEFVDALAVLVYAKHEKDTQDSTAIESLHLVFDRFLQNLHDQRPCMA